jgi:hypothetical protein
MVSAMDKADCITVFNRSREKENTDFICDLIAVHGCKNDLLQIYSPDKGQTALN